MIASGMISMVIEWSFCLIFVFPAACDHAYLVLFFLFFLCAFAFQSFFIQNSRFLGPLFFLRLCV